MAGLPQMKECTHAPPPYTGVSSVCMQIDMSRLDAESESTPSLYGVDIHYSASVQAAIDALFPTDDPLYGADFDVVKHVNKLFPNEQSLAALDDTIVQIEQDMAELDGEMAALVHAQSTTAVDGQIALQVCSRLAPAVHRRSAFRRQKHR
jgi:hypothetical protein